MWFDVVITIFFLFILLFAVWIFIEYLPAKINISEKTRRLIRKYKRKDETTQQFIWRMIRG